MVYYKCLKPQPIYVSREVNFMLVASDSLPAYSPEKVIMTRKDEIRLLLNSMRPRQWTKNLIVFAPMIFAAKLTEQKSFSVVFMYFIAFCLASSSVYLVNDVLDRKLDKKHPRKCQRPIASGKISLRLALWSAAFLALSSLALSISARPSLLLTTLSYLVISLLYSIFLKHLVIVDVMAIAAGFILRALGGGIAANVPISGWFLICSSCGSLFLALEKRRNELESLELAQKHRPALNSYSTRLLDRLEALVLPALLISYILYSLLSYHGQWMLLTVPFVFYGIAHYQELSITGKATGTPEEILLTDQAMQTTIVLWLITSLGVLYGFIPNAFTQLIAYLDMTKTF
jgi:4-hydroxybenzoate polyprenyltransferase